MRCCIECKESHVCRSVAALSSDPPVQQREACSHARMRASKSRAVRYACPEKKVEHAPSPSRTERSTRGCEASPLSSRYVTFVGDDANATTTTKEQDQLVLSEACVTLRALVIAVLTTNNSQSGERIPETFTHGVLWSRWSCFGVLVSWLVADTCCP